MNDTSRRASRVPWDSRRVLAAMTTATQPRSAVAELDLMGVVGTSAVLARPVSAKSFVERGKRVTNARRAFGGGDGGAKAEAARKEALASARESTSAAARARRLLDYSPGSSTHLRPPCREFWSSLRSRNDSVPPQEADP